MCDNQVKLARSCSTCRFGNFKKPTENYFTNRRNTGLCFLNIGADAEVPVVKHPYNAYRIHYDLPTVLKTGTDVYGNILLSRNDFIKHALNHIHSPAFSSIPERVQSDVEKLCLFYDESVAAREWWQANDSKIRNIHRHNTCECYEDNRKGEPTARSNAKKAAK